MKQILTILIASICLVVQAQESTTPTIDNQFETIIEKSNNFKEYKVVEKTKINQLRANTGKRISGLKNEIDKLEGLLKNRDEKINSLEQKLSGINTELSEVNEEKDSMNFLGIQTNKAIYNTAVWSIVGLLAFLFIFMSLRFKNSNSVTKAANKQLKTTEEELEELRRKSIEKEQKLGRQLQDERNKLSKLKAEK